MSCSAPNAVIFVFSNFGGDIRRRRNRAMSRSQQTPPNVNHDICFPNCAWRACVDQKIHAEQIAAAALIRTSVLMVYVCCFYWRKSRMRLQELLRLEPDVASTDTCKLLGEPCCSSRSSRSLPIKCCARGFNNYHTLMPARRRLWQRIMMRIRNFEVSAHLRWTLC